MVRNWKDVVLPPRMLKLEKDRRGYPVPFIIAKDVNGTPRFQINDDVKVERCLAHHLCAICGQHMPPDNRWMIGGPLSAFSPHGAYIDTPTHHACLRYAVQVCPYLAYSNYNNRIDLTGVDPAQYGFIYLQDPTQDEERVPFFVAQRPTSYWVRRPDQFTRYLVPTHPLLELEYYNDGRELSPYEARLLWWTYQARPELPEHKLLSDTPLDRLP